MPFVPSLLTSLLLSKELAMLKRFFLFSFIIFINPVFAESGPSNDNNQEKRACVNKAAQEHKSCAETCKKSFSEKKAECGIPSNCLLNCRSELENCLKPYEDSLESCSDGCEPAFSASRESCKQSTGCTGNCLGNKAFLECLRPALLVRFNCKRDCRDVQRTDSNISTAIQGCKTAFKSCKTTCKKPH